jgi:predicted DNA-binding protein
MATATKERKTDLLSIRVSEGEKRAIEKYARYWDESITDVIRDAIMEKIEDLEDYQYAVMAKMRLEESDYKDVVSWEDAWAEVGV